MNTNKIIGYILLTIGVLLIFWSFLQTYNIFTGKAAAPQVFSQTISLPTSQQTNPSDIQGQIQNALAKALPLNSINNMLNMTSWLILMWVLIYGGSKIAGIGVKLLNGNQ